MRFARSRGETGAPAQGVQHGDQNVQHNYFAPVTANLFAGPFERLQDVCFDPSVLARDLDLARFTGRTWLIGRIDAFIESRGRGWVMVLGEAGVGKSSLAGHLVWTRRWLHHFTRLPGGRSPEAARKSLAAQLIARWGLADWAPGGVLPGSAGRADWFDRLVQAAAERRDDLQPGEPIVLVVDGLDEAEADDDGALPLGLPASLPDGVFVVATSRFGIDQALHGLRNPAAWLEIKVEGTDNLNDMRQFIAGISDPVSGDQQLARALRVSGLNVDKFRQTLERRCAGVWIYLRYVLDEIRGGVRDPSQVDQLPGDLAGYYAEHIERWRGRRGDPGAQDRWDHVLLPLLGVLGAARAPLTVQELALFAGVPTEGAVRVFLEETARAFLSSQDDPPGPARYSVRHQSLRDLLSGVLPQGRPDLWSLTAAFASQNRLAHERIIAGLIPAGAAGDRAWQGVGAYAREHLAAHAAAAQVLDDLLSDPGFLAVAAPGSVLTQRKSLHSHGGRRALVAFEMSLNDWEACSWHERGERLAANAARVRAGPLLSACAKMIAAEWPIRWAAWSGRGHHILAAHKRRVLAVAIGRVGDCDVIVSGSSDGTVRVWDGVTGDPVGPPLADPHVIVVAIGRAGDCDVIVSGSMDGKVRVWDAVTGEEAGPALVGHGGPVLAVAVAKAGDRDVVVSGSQDGTVRVWDAVTGDWIGLVGHGGVVTTVAIGRAGDRDVIVSGSADGAVCVSYSVTGGSVGARLADRGAWVDRVAVGRAGGRDVILASWRDGTQRWDAVTGEPIDSPLIAHDARVFAIGRVGDRDVIVSDWRDMALRVWDAATGDPIDPPLAGHSPVTAVAIGRIGTRDVIVSGLFDGTVKVWDAAGGHTADMPLAGHSGPIHAVAIGRTGGRDVIVSGSTDGTARVWDAVTGDPMAPLLADRGMSAVVIGRAGTRDIIVSGSIDGTVRVRDAVTGDPIHYPLADRHNRTVNAVVIGRAGDRDVIVSGSSDGTVGRWDAVTGDPIDPVLIGTAYQVFAVAVGRAGDRDVIVGGSSEGKVWVWDPTGDSLFDRLLADRHNQAVLAVAVGRAGDRDVIVSGSGDGTVGRWDAVTGDPIDPLLGTGAQVFAVAVGRAGDRDVIVSGSDNGVVLVWDAVTGDPIGSPLNGHVGTVFAIAVGRAGDRDVIVSGSADQTVFLRARHGQDATS